MLSRNRSRYLRTQIPTQYQGQSEKELLQQFKTENWSSLNQKQRIDVFQELENKYAIAQQRPVAKIESEEHVGKLGQYLPSSNVIKIQVKDYIPGHGANNSYEQLDSYYHESRHAYQSQCMKTGRGLESKTLNMCKVEDTIGNYVNDGVHYDMQTCEMDSNNNAANRMLDNKDLFKDDFEYQKYFEQRQAHFQDVNQKCERYNFERVNRQLQMSEKSLACNDISKKQISQIQEHIKSGEADPVVTESKQLESKIRETQQELQLNNRLNTIYPYSTSDNVYNDVDANRAYNSESLSKMPTDGETNKEETARSEFRAYMKDHYTTDAEQNDGASQNTAARQEFRDYMSGEQIGHTNTNTVSNQQAHANSSSSNDDNHM